MSNLDDTMGTEVIVKKWGNSFAIILPRELVEERNLKENEKVSIVIAKRANLNDIFGALKGKKISGQKFKDFAREGWK